MANRRSSKSVKKERYFEVYFYVLSFLFVIVLSLLYYAVSHPYTTNMAENKSSNYITTVTHTSLINKQPNSLEGKYSLSSDSLSTRVIGHSYIYIPAVMNNSEPVYIRAEMYITKGNGNIFINVRNTLLGEDTQNSIRKAIRYATKHEHKNYYDYDYYVNVESNATVLTGPSAGGSFTILTIAALRNKIPSNKVMMTGTISSDGRIGISGKIYEKAKALKKMHGNTFIVPKGSGIESDIKPVIDCEYYDGKRYCDTIGYVTTTNLSQKLGINVVEVENIDEALLYFNI